MFAKVTHRRRLIACALSVLVLAGQLGSLAHSMLVRHVVCAEHGDLVHDDGSESLAAAVGDLAAVQSSPAIDTHAHDHCLLTLLRREQTAVASLARAVDLPSASCVSAVVRREQPRAVGSLLHVAPKLSPPV